MRDYSNYHNVNLADKIIHDGEIVLDAALNGFESYPVSIDDASTRAVIQSKFTSDDNKEFNITTKIGDMDFGSLVFHDNKNWLVTQNPVDNKIAQTSVIELCNNTLTIQIETQGEIIGYDSMGRPVYGQPTITNNNFPCIVKKISEMYNKSDGNDAVNIVQGSIVLQIQNTDDSSLFIGQKFKMFNTEYQITSFDLSETLNGTEGLLLIIADKTT